MCNPDPPVHVAGSGFGPGMGAQRAAATPSPQAAPPVFQRPGFAAEQQMPFTAQPMMLGGHPRERTPTQGAPDRGRFNKAGGSGRVVR